MSVLAPPVLRVTVVAGRRRLDLLLPAGVPVVEVVAELGRAGGLPPEPCWALARVAGGPLDPEQGLAEQGVADGALLTLLPRPLPDADVRYDDPVEAWCDRAAAVDAHAGSGRSPGALLAAATSALGALVLVWSRWGAVPAPVAAPAAVAVVALACAAPRGCALAWSVPPPHASPEPARLHADLRRVRALARGVDVGTALMLALLLPGLVASGVAGPVLALVCGLVLLGEAVPDRIGGLSRWPALVVLAATIASVLVERPELRVPVAVALLLGGAGVALVLALANGRRPRPGCPPRWSVGWPRRQCADAVRVAGLVSLTPLAVMVAGLPAIIVGLAR